MYKSFAEITSALERGESVESITRAYLERIEKNKHLNAFLEVFDEEALEEARRVDQKRADGSVHLMFDSTMDLEGSERPAMVAESIRRLYPTPGH